MCICADPNICKSAKTWKWKKQHKASIVYNDAIYAPEAPFIGHAYMF